MGTSVKIIPVKNRLGIALRKPGGIKRSDAVEAATANVETLRDEFTAAIPGEIAALEAMLDAAGRKRVPVSELDAMLRRAGQLLTLSGTFGYGLLDEVVKRFCDLACGMVEKNIEDRAPVDVHLQAMRLVCPGAPDLTEEAAQNILGGLEAVSAHYNIARLENPGIQAGEDLPVAAAPAA